MRERIIRARIAGIANQWIDFYVYEADPDQRKIWRTKPLEVVDSVEDMEVTPTFHISLYDGNSNSAQQLMDDLWACGLRPTEGRGSAGAMAATQQHLQDLQKIVFALLPEVQKVAR